MGRRSRRTTDPRLNGAAAISVDLLILVDDDKLRIYYLPAAW